MNMLDEYEAEWREGAVPEWKEYVRRGALIGEEKLIPELLQIDLERRWRSPSGTLRKYSVAEYMEFAHKWFDSEALLELMVSDYAVRNRWGDCPLIEEVLASQLGSLAGLSEALQRASSKIHWPRLAVENDGKVILQTPLDRIVELGRCQPGDPEVFQSMQRQGVTRVVVAQKDDVLVSRRQLLIRLLTPVSVKLTNCSVGRAVALAGMGTLEGSEERVLLLPVRIHIDEQLFISILPASAP